MPRLPLRSSVPVGGEHVAPVQAAAGLLAGQTFSDQPGPALAHGLCTSCPWVMRGVRLPATIFGLAHEGLAVGIFAGTGRPTAVSAGQHLARTKSAHNPVPWNLRVTDRPCPDKAVARNNRCR